MSQDRIDFLANGMSESEYLERSGFEKYAMEEARKCGYEEGAKIVRRMEHFMINALDEASFDRFCRLPFNDQSQVMYGLVMEGIDRFAANTSNGHRAQRREYARQLRKTYKFMWSFYTAKMNEYKKLTANEEGGLYELSQVFAELKHMAETTELTPEVTAKMDVVNEFMAADGVDPEQGLMAIALSAAAASYFKDDERLKNRDLDQKERIRISTEQTHRYIDAVVYANDPAAASAAKLAIEPSLLALGKWIELSVQSDPIAKEAHEKMSRK